MRRCDVRSLIACLTLLFLLGDVSAQTGQPLLRSSTELNRSSQRSTAVTQTGSAATAPALGDSQGRLPDSLVAALALDPAQTKVLDAAQEARRKMWFTNRNARQAEYAAITQELSTDKFDPRDVITLRKNTRAKIDAGFDEVQATWLTFWDALAPAQRKILIAYMREQHALQGKMSAAASAERSATRAAQRAALERSEARAAQQAAAGAPSSGLGTSVFPTAPK